MATSKKRDRVNDKDGRASPISKKFRAEESNGNKKEKEKHAFSKSGKKESKKVESDRKNEERKAVRVAGEHSNRKNKNKEFPKRETIPNRILPAQPSKSLQTDWKIAKVGSNEPRKQPRINTNVSQFSRGKMGPQLPPSELYTLGRREKKTTPVKSAPSNTDSLKIRFVREPPPRKISLSDLSRKSSEEDGLISSSLVLGDKRKIERKSSSPIQTRLQFGDSNSDLVGMDDLELVDEVCDETFVNRASPRKIKSKIQEESSSLSKNTAADKVTEKKSKQHPYKNDTHSDSYAHRKRVLSHSAYQELEKKTADNPIEKKHQPADFNDFSVGATRSSEETSKNLLNDHAHSVLPSEATTVSESCNSTHSKETPEETVRNCTSNMDCIETASNSCDEVNIREMEAVYDHDTDEDTKKRENLNAVSPFNTPIEEEINNNPDNVHPIEKQKSGFERGLTLNRIVQIASYEGRLVALCEFRNCHVVEMHPYDYVKKKAPMLLLRAFEELTHQTWKKLN